MQIVSHYIFTMAAFPEPPHGESSEKSVLVDGGDLSVQQSSSVDTRSSQRNRLAVVWIFSSMHMLPFLMLQETFDVCYDFYQGKTS